MSVQLKVEQISRKKKGLKLLNCNRLIYLVPLPRFERGACGLGIRRSILLSYRGDPVGKEVYLTRFSAGVNTGQARNPPPTFRWTGFSYF